MKSNHLRRFVIGLTGILFVIVVVLVSFRTIAISTHEIEYALPLSGVRIVARFKPIHPYLAEYERSIEVVLPNGKRTSAMLFPDTGGYSRSQLYRGNDGFLYFKGYFDVARIDMHSGTVELLSSGVPTEAEYLGAFDCVRSVGRKFLSPSESAEQSLLPGGG